jgi:hypothetical protein
VDVLEVRRVGRGREAVAKWTLRTRSFEVKVELHSLLKFQLRQGKTEDY